VPWRLTTSVHCRATPQRPVPPQLGSPTCPEPIAEYPRSPRGGPYRGPKAGIVQDIHRTPLYMNHPYTIFLYHYREIGMSIVQEITEILGEAEDRLKRRTLVALEENQFADVEVLAVYSGRLSEIIESSDVQTASPRRPKGNGGVAAPSPAKKKRTSTQVRAGRYPRFERLSDRLLKIGWSKQERSEYTHKAPKTAVLSVAATLRSTNGDTYTMDELLPISSDAGEVPSYQAYLVVAWLRSWGAVVSEGRGGYRAPADKITDEAIATHWAALDQHKSGG
jgi:hypothetical protein